MIDSEAMFNDYAGWAKVMLFARGIAPADLMWNLRTIGEVLTSNAPPNLRRTFARFINSACTALASKPSTLPSFIKSQYPLATMANSYLNSLLILDRETAFSTAMQALEKGLSITKFLEEVIYPVQQEVGRLWQENRISVLQEHYCTAATDLLLARLQQKYRGVPRSVKALAVCVDGEEHCLGLKMFSDLLESDGWKVAYIGPKCPTGDVLRHVRDSTPDLVAISVATPLNLAKARDLTLRIKSLPLKEHPFVIAGGGAFTGDTELWKSLGADGGARNISEGLALANRLVESATRH
ncbi:MAG TPA: cobalamin-dependent protein [Terriglobales bacterium]|nr:cobalamin-dependent protein [Terriglobales bacterium]